MSQSLALIFEDDPKLAELYDTVLKQCQYETRVVASGREARTCLHTLIPELILLDIHLPYVSGLEILKQIQADKRFDNTLIIVMTADLYKVKELEGKDDHVILKTHGITRLRALATAHINQDR